MPTFRRGSMNLSQISYQLSILIQLQGEVIRDLAADYLCVSSWRRATPNEQHVYSSYCWTTSGGRIWFSSRQHHLRGGRSLRLVLTQFHYQDGQTIISCMLRSSASHFHLPNLCNGRFCSWLCIAVGLPQHCHLDAERIQSL